MTCNVSNDKMVKRCRFFLHKRKILEFIEIVALSRFNDLVVKMDIHRTIPERRVENQKVFNHRKHSDKKIVFEIDGGLLSKKSLVLASAIAEWRSLPKNRTILLLLLGIT